MVGRNKQTSSRVYVLVCLLSAILIYMVFSDSSTKQTPAINNKVDFRPESFQRLKDEKNLDILVNPNANWPTPAGRLITVKDEQPWGLAQEQKHTETLNSSVQLQDTNNQTTPSSTQPTGLSQTNKTPNPKPSRNSSTSLEFSSNKSTNGLLTIAFKGGRLGSIMFAYASLYGLSQTTHKLPYLQPTNPLYAELVKNYNNLSLVQVREQPSNFTILTEPNRAHSVNPEFLAIKDTAGNYVLTAYMQAYRYFSKHTDLIREELKNFRKEIQTKCQENLLRTLGSTNQCVIIGVHCRRGDFLQNNSRMHGHYPAQADYVIDAMRFYRRRFSKRCVRFLVFGDDTQWNEQQFGNVSDVSIVKQNADAAVDMCMLARCNHSIITTGTFSWWSGFLTGGLVVRQSVYAVPGSTLHREYSRHDYFPPEWLTLEQIRASSNGSRIPQLVTTTAAKAESLAISTNSTSTISL